MKLKLLHWNIRIVLFFVIFNLLTFNINSMTQLIVSNRNNITNVEINRYLENNFVICAISNGNVNTNITARIYIHAKIVDAQGNIIGDSTTTKIIPEYKWEEEGNSAYYYGHTLLIKGKCVLESITDTVPEYIKIFFIDARENVEKMRSTNLSLRFIPYSSSYTGKIVINEVNYDTGYIWQKEWVEFYNTTSMSQDMNNFILRAFPDKDNKRDNKITPINTKPASTTKIPPNGYLVLVANLDYFTNFFPWVTPGQGEYKNTVIVEKDVRTKCFHLTNSPTPGFYNNNYSSGDSMVLLDSSSNIVERLDYKHSWKPKVSDISIERRDPSGDVNSGDNWGACMDPKGCTPGKVNSIASFKPAAPEPQNVDYIEISKKVFNPKKEEINIYFVLNETYNIKISVYNSEGVLMNNLFSAENISGNGNTTFTGKDRIGNYLSPGIYLIYMELIETEKNIIKKFTKPVVIEYW